VEDLAGRSIASYTLKELIGEGGMATVYKAIQDSLGRTVALKVLRPEVTTSAGFMKRFHNEVRTVSVLKKHPNISYPYTSGEEDGFHYLVMEYIDGKNLKDVIRAEGRLSVSRSIDVALQVCEALAYAHARGIIHRDVKPANIMVTPSGEVKVTDFGVAKTRYSEQLTVTGAIVGTPVYMSPEQASGVRTDHRADVYSVGVLLYEMLSGEVPFKGQDLVSLIYQITNTSPALLTDLVPDIPPRLGRIVAMALDRDRNIRYQDIKKLKRDLEKILREIRLGTVKRSSRDKGKAKKAPVSELYRPHPDSRSHSDDPVMETVTRVTSGTAVVDAMETRVIEPGDYNISDRSVPAFSTPPPAITITQARRTSRKTSRFGLIMFTALVSLALAGAALYGFRYYLRHRLLREARHEMALAQYGKVIRKLEPLAKQRGITPELQSLLGLAYYKKKHYDEALYHIKEAVTADPDNALYHFNLAMTYEKLEARLDAIKHFRLAIELDPNVVMFYDRFGEWVLVASKRIDEARERAYLGLAAMPVFDDSGSLIGMRVTGIDPGSAAARMAIRRGDIVTHIEDMPVTGMLSIKRKLDDIVPGEALLLRILRGERVVYYNFMTGKQPALHREGYL